MGFCHIFSRLFDRRNKENKELHVSTKCGRFIFCEIAANLEGGLYSQVALFASLQELNLKKEERLGQYEGTLVLNSCPV